MFKRMSLGVLGSLLMLAGGAQATESSDSLAASNPFARPSTLPYQLPPFDRIRNRDYDPAFAAGMTQQRADMRAIAENPAAPDFANTLLAMERSGRLLDRVSLVFFNLSASDTNPEIQKLEAQLAPQLAAHRDAILLDPQLFARVDALYRQRATLDLNPEQVRLIERYHTNFVRAGARLAPAQKDQLRALNARIAAAQTAYEQRLLAANNHGALIITDVRELDGLAPDAIAAAAEAAKARGLAGQYLIALQNTSGQPALTDLNSRAVRERLLAASMQRGWQDGDTDERALITGIARLRAERAQLLGYPDHATYALEDSTAKTPTAVNAMLGRLAPAAVANARREAVALQQAIDAQGGGFQLGAADWAHYAEQVRKQRYAFDEGQMKPYFEMRRVLEDGVFYAATRLYGITFKRRTDLPVYHPDVQVYEVFNSDGSRLGLFLADYYARPSKRGGAWMNNYVDQSHLLGALPVVVNNLNVPKPPAGQPTLLTFDEVTTAFHEFGHALHGLFSNVTYPLFSGTNVPRDFVEYPSQVNEMWATWPEVLTHYARHYQSGAPMPQELVAKVLAAQKFNQGQATTEYLAAALLDQAWHQVGPAQVPQAAQAEAFERAALAKAGVAFAPVPPRYRSTYFAHIFGGGYAAGYYSYIWSEVLDADSEAWFKRHGGLKRENGDAFRGKLLSKGGSVDAMTLFRDFYGAEPDIRPLLERRGLSGVGDT
jgi:peptidyl-dipeptidase Dcp